MTKVSIRRGVEGPNFDPYGYDEITVERTSPHYSGTVTIHRGLGEWLESRPAGRKEVYRYNRQDYKHLRALFQMLTGVTPEAAEHAHQELKARRIRYHACGHRHLLWVDGYPGEALLCCQKCGDVLDGTFDRSAVE